MKYKNYTPSKIYHGGRYDRLHNIWMGAKGRCNCETNKDYADYGGRGITIYSEWMDYPKFKSWALSSGYDDTLSLDRIDVNGNYEPSNCRWVTMHMQQRNKRDSRDDIYNGVATHIYDIADAEGIPIRVISNRYDRGDRGNRLTRPVRKYRGRVNGK